MEDNLQNLKNKTMEIKTNNTTAQQPKMYDKIKQKITLFGCDIIVNNLVNIQ